MERSAPTDLMSRFAHAVLTQNLHVKPGENVVIEGWSHSLPWATALARETRRLKAFPLTLYEDEDAFWDSVDSREEKLLGTAPAHEWALLGKTDVYIHMWGAGDKVRLNQMPPSRSSKIFAWNDAWYKAALKAGLRGARLEIGRPFPTLAKLYDADLDSGPAKSPRRPWSTPKGSWPRPARSRAPCRKAENYESTMTRVPTLPWAWPTARPL